MDNRINDLVQTGIETVEERIEFPPEYDSQGNLVREAFTEVIEHDVPIMETVYRDMTPEEEADARAFEASMPEPQPTIDDRVKTLKGSTDELADMVLALCDLIEGGK